MEQRVSRELVAEMRVTAVNESEGRVTSTRASKADNLRAAIATIVQHEGLPSPLLSYDIQVTYSAPGEEFWVLWRFVTRDFRVMHYRMRLDGEMYRTGNIERFADLLYAEVKNALRSAAAWKPYEARETVKTSGENELGKIGL